MKLKKMILPTVVAFFGLSSTAFAVDISNEDPRIDEPTQASQTLKFSGFINLVCDSPATCGTYTSGWYSAKVYQDFVPDIPPRLEMRLFWKKNEPANIAAGRYRAKTVGDYCPDGSRMTAEWFLTSGGAPHYATSKDCEGVTHSFRVLQLP